MDYRKKSRIATAWCWFDRERMRWSRRGTVSGTSGEFRHWGLAGAINDHALLKDGVHTDAGRVVCKPVADSLGLPWPDQEEWSAVGKAWKGSAAKRCEGVTQTPALAKLKSSVILRE